MSHYGGVPGRACAGRSTSRRLSRAPARVQNQRWTCRSAVFHRWDPTQRGTFFAGQPLDGRLPRQGTAQQLGIYRCRAQKLVAACAFGGLGERQGLPAADPEQIRTLRNSALLARGGLDRRAPCSCTGTSAPGRWRRRGCLNSGHRCLRVQDGQRLPPGHITPQVSSPQSVRHWRISALAYLPGEGRNHGRAI